MNAVEKNLAIKNSVLNTLMNSGALDGATQVGNFSFAIPVTVDGEDRFAVIDITAKNNKDTKTTLAFDVESAHDKWQAAKALSAEKAALKAAEKAAKAKKAE